MEERLGRLPTLQKKRDCANREQIRTAWGSIEGEPKYRKLRELSLTM
jgi:hypothetical protein